MRESVRELHVERLLGKKVRDQDGDVVGRIEEIRADAVNGETVVTEFDLGPAAVLERLGGYALHVPLVRLLPLQRHGYRVPWSALDLTNPDRPRLLGRRGDLERRVLD